MKLYITIDDFDEVRFHKGRIPAEVLGAVDDGYYNVIDITNPLEPKVYMGGGVWEDIDPLVNEENEDET